MGYYPAHRQEASAAWVFWGRLPGRDLRPSLRPFPEPLLVSFQYTHHGWRIEGLTLDSTEERGREDGLRGTPPPTKIYGRSPGLSWATGDPYRASTCRSTDSGGILCTNSSTPFPLKVTAFVQPLNPVLLHPSYNGVSIFVFLRKRINNCYIRINSHFIYIGVN